mmetsp:Transcript_40887/g.161953  ORF Transcript_40887/g.161953 Transcript_40887/m.161953 type:complete len:106 (-) Transcript_40887:263-580(-)
MQPLWDNVGVIKSVNTTKQGNGKVVENAYVADVDYMIESQFLEIAPLAYIRGRSFHDAYFIVDEAQNLTPHEVSPDAKVKVLRLACFTLFTCMARNLKPESLSFR